MAIHPPSIEMGVFLLNMIKMLPVLCGIAAGYITALFTGNVSWEAVSSAGWLGIPAFVLPKFSPYALMVIVPVILAPTIEHFGDIFAISAVTGQKCYEDPGEYLEL